MDTTIGLEGVLKLSEDEARQLLECIRWPDGVECPTCRSRDARAIRAGTQSSARPGLFRCGSCRRQFTVRVGTPLEGSSLALTIWLAAIVAWPIPSDRRFEKRFSVSRRTAYLLHHRLGHARGLLWGEEDEEAGLLEQRRGWREGWYTSSEVTCEYVAALLDVELEAIGELEARCGCRPGSP